MTTDPRHQKEENELDREIGQVRSTWAGLEKEEPPHLLDQAVLNRAQRELGSPGTAGRKRWALGWPGAFATAAVVLLALTIVIEQQQQAPAPVAEEADGFKIDRDGPFTSKKEKPPEAAADRATAQENLAEKTRNETRTKPLLMDSASTRAAAEQSDAGIPAVLAKSQGELPAVEAWIEQLLQLKKDHQDEQLAEELSRFRAAYPDYPLPNELDD